MKPVFLASIFLLWSSGWVSRLQCTMGVEGMIVINRENVGVWFNYTNCHDDHGVDYNCTSQELREMITLVDTRFSKIMIDVPPSLKKLPPEDSDESHSRILLPSLIAEYNKANLKNKQTSMKVTVTFKMPPRPSTYSYGWSTTRGQIQSATSNVTSFEVAKFMADKANAIFPETVSTLLLLRGSDDFFRAHAASRLTSRDTNPTATELKTAREMLNSTSANYALGTVMSVDECGKFRGTVSQYARDLMPYVDVIVLPLTLPEVSYYFQIQHKLNAETEHKALVARFEDCERRLRTISPSVKVIPFVLCSAHKFQSFSVVLQCWKMMSDWAQESGREVIMFEAFDNYEAILEMFGMYNYGSRPFRSMGWWQLKRALPGSSGASQITQSSFLEKAQSSLSDLEGEARKITKDDEIEDCATESPFSHWNRDLMGVSFKPYVRYFQNDGNTSYTSGELSAMVKVIGTRFKTVILDREGIDLVSDSEYRALIDQFNSTSQLTPNSVRLPFVVGEYNKVRRADSGGGVMNAWMRSPGGDVSTLVYHAESVNRLYGDTITGILLIQSGSFSPVFYSGSIQVAETKANVVRTSGLVVGFYFDIDTCGGFRGPIKPNTTARKLVDLADVFFIELGNEPSTYGMDVRTTQHMRISQFEDCEGKLKRLKPEIEVVPQISCGNSVLVGVSSMDCWRGYAKWAEESGRKVIMGYAMDQPTRRVYEGWWQLKDLATVNITEASFIEKFQKTSNCTSSLSPEYPKEPALCGTYNDMETTVGESPGESSSPAVVGLSIFCVLLLIVIAVLLLKMYRPRRGGNNYHYICRYDTTPET